MVPKKTIWQIIFTSRVNSEGQGVSLPYRISLKILHSKLEPSSHKKMEDNEMIN